MAERKSFVIYPDWRDWLNLLSKEQRGDWISALFDYQCEGQPYDGDDPLVKVTLAFARTTLDRDNEKYRARCAANARNGQREAVPGRPLRQQKTRRKPTGLQTMQKNRAKLPYSRRSLTYFLRSRKNRRRLPSIRRNPKRATGPFARRLPPARAQVQERPLAVRRNRPLLTGHTGRHPRIPPGRPSARSKRPAGG
ncbi:MAG: DUF6291 domain-containing protein [Clostridium sp.]|nr:DUF6291 domain-containing protein [Clostridium sp.]